MGSYKRAAAHWMGASGLSLSDRRTTVAADRAGSARRPASPVLPNGHRIVTRRRPAGSLRDHDRQLERVQEADLWKLRL
jgi:hypothetical protein